MLVLSRQRDESIEIGDGIVITVVDIRGDKVRLGVTAPRDVSVHRREIAELIRQAGRSPASLRREDRVGFGRLGRGAVAAGGAVSPPAAPVLAPATPPTPPVTDASAAGTGDPGLPRLVGREGGGA